MKNTLEIYSSKSERKYKKAKLNIKAISIALICIVSVIAIMSVNLSEAQTPKLNCENANFCSKDDEASPSGEIQTTEEKCNSIEIYWKNTEKKNIDCNDVRTIIKHFGKDEKLIAILLHESALERHAINKNPDGSIDRGIYMLNSNFWKFKTGDLEYNSEQAVECKKQLGYNCWWAFRNGEYKQHITNAKYILSKI